MEDPSRIALHDIHLASRKAEEAALRRFQAAGWLESFVGPVGFSDQPSEFEFVTILKNGIVLCNVINKIQPGAVPKVVENHSTLLPLEAPPLLAYQYFENVRNFLVAVQELKLPAFEASDLETDNLEAGSTSKIVDCVLALKEHHELKQWRGKANGAYKPIRSPMVPHFAGRGYSQVAPATSLGSRRHLDMSVAPDEKQPIEAQNNKHEDALVGALTQCLLESKENIDHSLLASFRQGNLDPVKFFGKIMSSCFQEEQISQCPELKSIVGDFTRKENSPSTLAKNSMTEGNNKCSRTCIKMGNCNHRHLLKEQERDLADIKTLLSKTKIEFEHLQIQFQSDLKHLGTHVEELSSAALGYQRVVKENRDLYNMVMDLKGNIRVFCRIRPSFSGETKNVIDFIGDDGSVVVVDPLKPYKDGRKVFQFNRVFGSSTSQDEVFQDTQPLIRSVMDGYNVCIFAYGQTGSGKTHTMCGPSGGSSKEMGVNFMALNDLFYISRIRKDIMNYEIRVQMVEIYNEQVRDLLGEESSTTRLEIRNCTSNGGLSLPDATLHLVASTGDVLNLMKLGEKNRAVCATAINNRSSRSHSVLTVHVQGKDTSGSILHSCLHLVDLAGSERVDKSEVTGDRLKEAQYINKSLSCLGDVIMALAQKNSHIPYRNSKLTQLLQDSLGGNAKTLMFAHVSPEADSFSETISTLKFAQRVSTVEIGSARLNKENSELRELREQVETLKRELANKEAQSIQTTQAKELKSPLVKPKAMTDRTPPRPRRLSIENCTVAKMEKPINSESKKILKTPAVNVKPATGFTPKRPRRLSLECPVSVKKPQLHLRSSENPVLINEVQAMGAQPFVEMCADSRSDGSYPSAEPPISSSKFRDISSRTPTSEAMGRESRKRIEPVQILKTPEPLRAKNDVQMTPNNLGQVSQTPGFVTSTAKKGSHIRKSLHTIGKLINGSEKRSHQLPRETNSPSNGIASSEKISPSTATGQTSRRQSLTGVLPSGVSRRSSLGGISTDSYSSDTRRNAKTPPPVHLYDKAAKRWL